MKAPPPDAACWIDGRRTTAGEARLPIDDPACLAGVGLFETMAVESGIVLDLPEHLDRLERSAADWRLALPDRGAVVRILEEAAAAAGAGWVKLVVTGGGRSIVFGGPAVRSSEATAVVLPWRRDRSAPLAAHKSLSRADAALGLAWARDRGADEGLWLNDRGHVAEACTANVFVIHGRRLFTPGPGEGILAGIVRARAIAAARELGWLVHEGKLRLERFRRAEEAFLTSSVAGVRPLVAVDGRPVGSGSPGPRTERLAGEVARLRRAALDTAGRDREL
jgi:branched-subunit amino acid aminotransferase/4-amino-4-deoxychorismate lyase